MNLYLLSLLLGAVGFGTMAVGGLGRRGGRATRGGKGARAPHSRVGRLGRGGARHTVGRALLALTSPRFVFSVAMGAGLTGLLFGRVFHEPALACFALGGGLLFEHALVTPLWDTLMRFASRPALTLESCVRTDATAVTAFDRNGSGIVAVELDGQIVQLLATRRAVDCAAGTRVLAGNRVRIVEVDAERNRCTVSLLLNDARAYVSSS